MQKSRADKSITDAAGRGQMNAEGLRDASRIEMPRLRCQHQHSELRQSYTVSDLCYGFRGDCRKNVRRIQQGFHLLCG